VPDFRRAAIYQSRRPRADPEPETVNHRTKLTPNPLGAPLAGPRPASPVLWTYPPPPLPPAAPLTIIYFREGNIDFFINNRPPGRPPSGKSLAPLSLSRSRSLARSRARALVSANLCCSDRLIPRRSACRYRAKHFARQCSGIMYSENLEGIQPRSVSVVFNPLLPHYRIVLSRMRGRAERCWRSHDYAR